MTMHTIAIAWLACSACTIHARRVQTLMEFQPTAAYVPPHAPIASRTVMARLTPATESGPPHSRSSKSLHPETLPQQHHLPHRSPQVTMASGTDSEPDEIDETSQAVPDVKAENVKSEEVPPTPVESTTWRNRGGILGFFFLLVAAVIDKFATAPPGTPAVATPDSSVASNSKGGETLENEISLKGVTGLNRFRLACWKFLRPHTIRGTILGSSAVTLRAVLENPVAVDFALIPRAALGVLCLLCGNGYIVGINQIYDVDIDTINKPFLPVAAGELSKPMAWALCLIFAAAGLGLTAFNFGSHITCLYAFGLLLGTVYSVPPLRLKRFPVPAFMIIATVRGFLLNFGVYSAARAAMQLPFVWSPTIIFVTCFVTWFATVIAVSKDLPDIEGDRRDGIETFAVRLGADKLSYIASGMLVLLYSVGAAMPILFPASFRLWLMTPFHAIVVGLVIRAALRLRASNWSQPGIKSFYRFVWSIFYASYLFLPFLAPLPKAMRLA